MPQTVSFEDLPLSRFHLRVTFSGTGGQLSDGFVLGIIGIAVSMATIPLHLNALWTGLLGAASLGGLFLGSLCAGPIADRFGRKTIFAWDMLVFSIISGAQFFVTDAWQLLVLRVLLGLTLGADYVVSKALVTEYSPLRFRGRLLSILAAAWAAGYVGAYVVGYLMRDLGPDAWRWMLAASAVPSLVVLLARIGVPESPLWLARKGRRDEALKAVQAKFGSHVTLPVATTAAAKLSVPSSSLAQLFSSNWRTNTLVAAVFYTCQVIPYFALGTFSPRVLEALNVRDKLVGGLIYNICLLVGAVLGLAVIDIASRRAFLISTFFAAALTLLILAFGNCGPAATVGLFAVFACILSAAANLEFVYPPELFPTELRASGVGVAVASSRFGSAVSTFLLPIAVQAYGIQPVLAVCVGILLFGGLFCQFFAPETGKTNLAQLTVPAA